MFIRSLRFGVSLTDWHLSLVAAVSYDQHHRGPFVDNKEKSIGFTVGPKFLSVDINNDIGWQVIDTPDNYIAPASDLGFDANLIVHLNQHTSAPRVEVGFNYTLPEGLVRQDSQSPAKQVTHRNTYPNFHDTVPATLGGLSGSSNDGG